MGQAKTFAFENAPNKSWRERWDQYPKSIAFIVGNEFCERFSYYGMRAVLTLYLINVLKFDSSAATAIFSGYVMLCYFSPILGSILADGYIGKFYTIMWVSLFYACGNVVIAVAASFDSDSIVHPWLDFIGLIIIGFGTGGIKPCVLPFGADQFQKGQERELSQFFSLFYFTVKAGSTISMLLTPSIRTQPCQDQTTCYPLAFGIPSSLMVVAVAFFAFGSYWYRKPTPQGNVFAKVAKVSSAAIKNKQFFDMKKEHWLDHYLDNHTCKCDEECRDQKDCQKAQFVTDIKALLRVLILFVPLPVFWALYDQQSSSWIIQGTQMNSEIAEGVFFLPDQMGVLNSILIMILIPTFQFGIYPLVGKCVKLTPLRKMSAGGMLAGVAYIVCMLVQIKNNSTLPRYPESGQTLMTVTNYVQQCDSLRFVGATTDKQLVANATILRDGSQLFPLKMPYKQIVWQVQEDSSTAPCRQWITETNERLKQMNVTLYPNKAGYTIFTDDVLDVQLTKQSVIKSESGKNVFSLNVNYYAKADWINMDKDGIIKVALCRNVNDKCMSRNAEEYKEFKVNSLSRTSASKYADVKPGTWGIFVERKNDSELQYIDTFTKKEQGGIMSLTLISDNQTEAKMSYRITRQSPDNTVSILWQVPQYFVISVAEILFAITGYEFAYSQAPLSMKSLAFALYLATEAFGSVIILIISLNKASGFDMSWIFLIYACIMFAVMLIFMLIAYRYKYVYYVRDDDKATT